MKVLLVIYNYKAGFPFIQDIEKNLKQQEGVVVDVLDSDELLLRKDNGSIVDFNRWFLKYAVRLPKLGTAVKVVVLRAFLRGLRGKYDVVNVHNCDPIYIYLAREFRLITPNFYPMIWGSDFYRATKKWREKKRVIFDNARFIIFANPVNASHFIDYYKNYKDKAIITGFGVAKFDIISAIKEEYSMDARKLVLALPKDKVIVAVGYNGTPGQQHLKILNELATLSKTTKGKIFLLLQMTYGFNRQYTDLVLKQLSEMGIEFNIITDFLDDEKTSMIRATVDIVLNAQISDGFSSSIQEHIFARNIVIVGDWLPYEPLTHAGIFYLKKPLSDFGVTVDKIVSDLDYFKELTVGNDSKIYGISSWTCKIKNWLAIFKGEGSRFLYNESQMFIK